MKLTIEVIIMNVAWRKFELHIIREHRQKIFEFFNGIWPLSGDGSNNFVDT